MKKSLLLLVAGAITMSAGAQNARFVSAGSGSTSQVTPKTGVISTPSGHNFARAHSAARTTSTCTISEDFHSGTYATMPTGWTAVATSGPGTWHWANTASGGAAGGAPILPALASSTASNGWMIFNSDSLAGGPTGTLTPAGYLQSPSYNCSGLATVRLSFQEVFAKFRDSTRVWVSSNAGSTWTVYPIPVNDDLSDNDGTLNPQTVHIDISAAAALKPAVLIRFVYACENPGGGYSWSIDDICLGPKDPHDVGIEKSWVFEPHCTSSTGAYDGSIFSTPLAFVDSIYPITRLTNYGSSDEATVALSSKIYKSGSTTFAYTSSISYTDLVQNSIDSFVDYDGFLPASTGTYFVANNATVAGDADASNDNDTTAFAVTDTTFQDNIGNIEFTSGYFVYEMAGNKAFYTGSRFDVPCGATPDTVSGFGVMFSSASVAGPGTVTVQLYSTDKASAAWTYLGSSVAKAPTASLFSTSTTARYADFRIDQTNGVAPFILTPGNSYAAVIQTNGLTKDLVVAFSNPPNATGYAPGYFGQAGQSSNDGGQTFGTTVQTGQSDFVPALRMYTGPITLWPSAVTNINVENNIGEAFPNPSNTNFTVPFTMGRDGKVTVTLTDITGQTVNTQVVNAIGGQAAKAEFNTANLAAGVYMYTVQANGQRTTSRVVVAH